MGQQQLLLVILVTIIVGIATVVAINTFSGAADSANLDAVRQDVASIAASAQGYYLKPTMLGGGGNSFVGLTFNNLAFGADSIASNGLTAKNQNGKYVIGSVTASNFVVTAHPSSQITGSVLLGSTAANTMAATISESNVSWTDNSVTN